MKTLSRALLFVVLLAICLASPAARAEGAFSDDPDRIEEAAQSVLVLEMYGADGESLGTASGFVAFDNRTLVTSLRAIQGATGIIANSEDGFQYVVDKALILDEARDVAILGFFSPTDLVPLALDAEAAPKRAQTVVAIGSPVGLTNTVSIGTVSAVYEDGGVRYIQFTAPIASGLGGALFDESGAVVGLALGSADAQSVGTAVRAGEIADLYAQWDGATTTALPALGLEASGGTEITDGSLLLCDAGWDIEDPDSLATEFTELSEYDLAGGIDFYALLTFSTGAAFADVVVTFSLYGDGALLDEMTAEVSLGQSEASPQRYFDITAMVRGVPAPGEYEIVCALDGVEQGSLYFYVYEEVATNTYAALTYGDRGEAVRQMQAALISLGYLDDTADGAFGKNTGAAVLDFNLANGICVRSYGDGEFIYDRDPETAWNETLQLLYDGDPLPYAEPYMPLILDYETLAQWDELDSDELQIRFQVKNDSKYSTVESFTIYVYATDYYDNYIYGENQVYQFTTWKKVKPGAIVYSDYFDIAYLSQIYKVHCGIVGVTLTSGESVWLDGSEIDYWVWSYVDYN